MSGPHVGYVLKVYPRLSETFIINEILELERRGVRVTIFSLRAADTTANHESLSRVKADVVYLPERSTSEIFQFVTENRASLARVKRRLGHLLWEEIESQTPVRLLGKAAALHLEVEARGVDHLHAHFGTSATEAARMVSCLSGIGYSFTAHAKDLYLASRDLSRLSCKMRDASFVVTVCDANRTWLERVGAGDTPVYRIYNGLDLDRFRPDAPEPRARFEIVGVGRLVPKKGFDTLVRASRILKERGVPFRTRIVGDGAERESLERTVREEGVEDVVELAGPLPNEQVRAAILAADVVALPARVAEDGNRDALPTVLLEAMALGRPFVSTPVTGIPEIADSGRTGVLVPPDRPLDLADALERLARSPSVRASLAENGLRRVAELFDIRRNVAELHHLFRQSVGATSVPTARAAGV